MSELQDGARADMQQSLPGRDKVQEFRTEMRVLSLTLAVVAVATAIQRLVQHALLRALAEGTAH